MPRNATAPSRLADLMNKRRLALRLQWDEVAERAKISTAHLRKFRSGEAGLSELAVANLEEALQWESGSIPAIQAGGNPTPIEQRQNAHPGRDIDKTLGEMLLERGLAKIEELTIADNIRNDPVAWEILEMEELSEETRNRFLAAYAHTRREIFESVRQERQAQMEKKKPRV